MALQPRWKADRFAGHWSTVHNSGGRVCDCGGQTVRTGHSGNRRNRFGHVGILGSHHSRHGSLVSAARNGPRSSGLCMVRGCYPPLHNGGGCYRCHQVRAWSKCTLIKQPVLSTQWRSRPWNPQTSLDSTGQRGNVYLDKRFR